MKSNNFIKEKLNDLVLLFPNIKCSYEFDEFDNTHVVEVVPSDFYNNSIELSKAMTEIDILFIGMFPYEGLYFIDDKNMFPIKNLFYSVKGRDYDVVQKYSSAKPQMVVTPSYINYPNFLVSSNNEINIISSGNITIDTRPCGDNTIEEDSICRIIDGINIGEETFALAA
jgi:hypothetical protein